MGTGLHSSISSWVQETPTLLGVGDPQETLAASLWLDVNLFLCQEEVAVLASHAQTLIWKPT